MQSCLGRDRIQPAPQFGSLLTVNYRLTPFLGVVNVSAMTDGVANQPGFCQAVA